MVVYTNADFISLNEENLTYSVLVEDKGKIAYIGYNTPLCYRDAKVVDLEGKAVLPAVNDLIPVDCKDAGCAVLAVGESADFAVLDKNILKDPTASVEVVYLRPRHQQKPLSVFSYLKCYSKRRTPKSVCAFCFPYLAICPLYKGALFFVFLPLLLMISPAFSSYSVSAAPRPQTQRQCRKPRQKQCPQ